MSSNFERSSARKSLVATCVAVWGGNLNVRFQRLHLQHYNIFYYSIGKKSVFRYCANAFFLPQAKVFVCSTKNTFVIYLDGGLEKPQKRTETWEKVSPNFIHLRNDGAEKITETRQI